jgi:hypothetical protein
MKPGSTTTSRRPRKRTRNGAIPLHQNHKNFAHNHLQERLRWLFWDERGVILEHYMARGNTVTSATYSDLLKNHLCPAIKSKRCGRLSTGVLLQHDNARPHTARSTVATIQDLSFECLPHPPFSPVLAPVIFMWLGRWNRRWEASLSGPTKRSSRQCTSGCTLNQKNFFYRGIHALPKRWNTCIARTEDYVEKWSHCVPFVFSKLWDKNKCFHLNLPRICFNDAWSNKVYPGHWGCRRFGERVQFYPEHGGSTLFRKVCNTGHFHTFPKPGNRINMKPAPTWRRWVSNIVQCLYKSCVRYFKSPWIKVLNCWIPRVLY